jgi:hypothetical protein
MFNRTSIAVVNSCQGGRAEKNSVTPGSPLFRVGKSKRGAKIFGTEDLKDLKGLLVQRFRGIRSRNRYSTKTLTHCLAAVHIFRESEWRSERAHR